MVATSRAFYAPGEAVAETPDYEHGQPQPVPHDDRPSMHDEAVQSIRERKDYGRTKYGTILQIGNGRDFLTDAHEEALDGLAYLEGMRAEREVEKEILRRFIDQIKVWPFLNDLPRIPWVAQVIAELCDGTFDGWGTG